MRRARPTRGATAAVRAGARRTCPGPTTPSTARRSRRVRARRFVVDPPNGRIPSLTPEARGDEEVRREWRVMLMRNTPTCEQQAPGCEGGQYPGHRDHEFLSEVPVSRLDREPKARRAVHRGRRRHARLRGDHRGSDRLDVAVDCPAGAEASERPAESDLLRAAVPRGELRVGRDVSSARGFGSRSSPQGAGRIRSRWTPSRAAKAPGRTRACWTTVTPHRRSEPVVDAAVAPYSLYFPGSRKTIAGSCVRYRAQLVTRLYWPNPAVRRRIPSVDECRSAADVTQLRAPRLGYPVAAASRPTVRLRASGRGLRRGTSGHLLVASFGHIQHHPVIRFAVQMRIAKPRDRAGVRIRRVLRAMPASAVPTRRGVGAHDVSASRATSVGEFRF